MHELIARRPSRVSLLSLVAFIALAVLFFVLVEQIVVPAVQNKQHRAPIERYAPTAEFPQSPE
jgi:hypothetical protein